MLIVRCSPRMTLFNWLRCGRWRPAWCRPSRPPYLPKWVIWGPNRATRPARTRHTPGPNAPHAGADRATRQDGTRHTPGPNAPHAGADRATRQGETRHTPGPNAPHAGAERATRPGETRHTPG